MFRSCFYDISLSVDFNCIETLFSVASKDRVCRGCNIGRTKIRPRGLNRSKAYRTSFQESRRRVTASKSSLHLNPSTPKCLCHKNGMPLAQEFQLNEGWNVGSFFMADISSFWTYQLLFFYSFWRKFCYYSRNDLLSCSSTMIIVMIRILFYKSICSTIHKNSVII